MVAFTTWLDICCAEEGKWVSGFQNFISLKKNAQGGLNHPKKGIRTPTAIDCKKKTKNMHLLMRKMALKFGRSRQRETGLSHVVDDKTATQILARAYAATFTLLPVVILLFVVVVA